MRSAQQEKRGAARLVHVLDIGALLVHVVLQDELLQVEEGALVPRVLPHLRAVNLGDVSN